MSALDIAQKYFDGWNQRDARAVLATFADGGTYQDPTTNGPLSGEAFIAYMDGLFAAFPDLSFEMSSAGLIAPDLVAAQWMMRGTNLGSMNGLPPSGKPIELAGADFIRVSGDKIQSVTGYFDAGVIPRQIGLQVVVQPTAIGPFDFGTSVRVSSGSNATPGAFSITCLEVRSPEEQKAVSEQSQIVATEMLGMKGFIAFVGATLGNRMMTISAWENPDDPKQLMRVGQHTQSVKNFFSQLSAGGHTGVWTSARLNDRLIRCTACERMQPHAATCGCGAALPSPIAYW